jgi:hypothetical protein
MVNIADWERFETFTQVTRPSLTPTTQLPTHLRKRIIPLVVVACSTFSLLFHVRDMSPVRTREKVGVGSSAIHPFFVYVAMVEFLVTNFGSVVLLYRSAIAIRGVGVDHLPRLPAEEGCVKRHGARGWE